MHCPFCDFYTRPNRNPSEKNEYVRAVLAEIDLAPVYGWPDRADVPTVFFGGGTPSLTDPADLARVLDRLRERFAFRHDAEVSIEINPEDVTADAARKWLSMGINRFSLGVQAIHDAELLRLGRAHRARHNLEAIEILRSLGAGNVGVDLMFGLEGQTVDGWLATLETVVSWDPEHVSCYNLTVEERTRYAVDVRLGRRTLPDDETQGRMLLAGRSYLRERGWAPYEISNYARPGFESRHNRSYWTGQNYWGLGVSAHSLQREGDRIRRFWHPRSLRAYVDGLSAPGRSLEEEKLSVDRHFRERVMTGLRQTQGLDVAALASEWDLSIPRDVQDALDRWIVQGALLREGDRVRLSEAGILVSDTVFSDLF